MIQPEILNKIEQHYNHACMKHPDFVQNMGVGEYANICAVELARKRKVLKFQEEWGELSLSAVLTCEMREFFDAIANARLQEAIEEGYDIIAVVLRAIERIKKLEVAKPEEVAVAKMETTTPTCDKSSHVGNAKPLRNCDVGSVEEQYARFKKWCEGEFYKRPMNPLTGEPCKSCPCYSVSINGVDGCNYLLWAQMQYEKEGEA